MSVVTVPAALAGEPFNVDHDGHRIRVSRRSAFNNYTHTLVFRPAEFIDVFNAGVDLMEADALAQRPPRKWD